MSDERRISKQGPGLTFNPHAKLHEQTLVQALKAQP